MKKYIPTFIFAAFILGFFLWDIMAPDKDFSEMENRYLAQYIPPTKKTLIENKFMTDYETYVNDQFVLRSEWITVKSVGESILLKTENNGIAYGKDHFMFDMTTIDTSKDSRMYKNLDYLMEFAADNKYEKIYFTAVPGSGTVYKEKLPYMLKLDDQFVISENLYKILEENSTIMPVNINKELYDNKDSYIYYKTDHHWTTYGAYVAYSSFNSKTGEKTADIKDFKPNEVKDFYGTYYSKTKLFSAVPDTITYYDIPVDNVIIDGEEKGSMYDEEQFSKRDKYAGILYGNHGLEVIKSKVKNGKKLLVFRDSYAASLVPFFAADYEEIFVVDLRYYKETQKLMEENKFDDIYIIYYLLNFSTDGNVINIFE